jgi:hypothetical protein
VTVKEEIIRRSTCDVTGLRPDNVLVVTKPGGHKGVKAWGEIQDQKCHNCPLKSRMDADSRPTPYPAPSRARSLPARRKEHSEALLGKSRSQTPSRHMPAARWVNTDPEPSRL